MSAGRCGPAVAAGVVCAAVIASVTLAADPVLSLTDPRTGKTVAVPAAPGVLHIVYFATWCPECVEELPELADLEDRWAERDYRLVLVAVNTRQSESRLTKFIDSNRPPGQLLFDATGGAQRAMKVEQLPTHVLVGPAGAELARGGSLAAIRAPLEQRLRSGGPSKR